MVQAGRILGVLTSSSPVCTCFKPMSIPDQGLQQGHAPARAKACVRLEEGGRHDLVAVCAQDARAPRWRGVDEDGAMQFDISMAHVAQRLPVLQSSTIRRAHGSWGCMYVCKQHR